MFVYTQSSARATRPAAYTSCPQHRTDLARAAVYTEFGARDARALDQGDFQDRQPDQPPRLLGQVAAKVTYDTGQKAMRHWLAQAAEAESEEQREAALKIAHSIARLAGLDADLIGHEAA